MSIAVYKNCYSNATTKTENAIKSDFLKIFLGVANLRRYYYVQKKKIDGAYIFLRGRWNGDSVYDAGLGIFTCRGTDYSRFLVCIREMSVIAILVFMVILFRQKRPKAGDFLACNAITKTENAIQRGVWRLK